MASKGQKFKKYTPEEKIKYAKMIVNGETSAKEIAKKLNIYQENRNSLD